MTCSLTSATGTPSSHLNGQGSTLKTRLLPREPTSTAGTGNGLVAAATRVREQVPAPDRWGETFSDDIVAAAMIDRLVHHAEVLTLTGDS
ncbi:ATP-binding protein, partial [Kitasatospora purpeofusca]|uniref:ATP-binding protein n=1 Tax=Kitasatospora purpeofusca TaxID=67352 RepID=UPI00380A38B8